MSHIELSSIQFEFCSFCSLHVTLMVCFKAVFLLIIMIIIPDLPTSHDSTAVLFCGWPKLMQILVKDFMEKSFCKSNYVLYSLSLSLRLKICLSVCLNLSLSVCLSVCLSASYLFIVIFKVFSMIVKFLSVCYY